MALKSTPGNAESQFLENFDKSINRLTHGNGTIQLTSKTTWQVGGAAAEAEEPESLIM